MNGYEHTIDSLNLEVESLKEQAEQLYNENRDLRARLEATLGVAP
jgi:FtsZ-binding cell division protein ZapB